MRTKTNIELLTGEKNNLTLGHLEENSNASTAFFYVGDARAHSTITITRLLLQKV